MGETKNLNESTGSKKVFTIYHVPCHLYVVMLGIVLACIYTNVVPFGLPAALAVLLILSAVLGEIGDRIPIWNEFIGGGCRLSGWRNHISNCKYYVWYLLRIIKNGE